MIEKYKIKKINNEEVLFIYLDYNYEFGNIGNKNNSILNQVKNTINNIKYGGEKVVLMVGTVAIATLLFTGTGFKGNIITEDNIDYFNSGILETTEVLVEDNNLNNPVVQEITKTEDDLSNVQDLKVEEIITNQNIQDTAVINNSNINNTSNTNTTPVKENIVVNNNPVITEEPTSQASNQPVVQEQVPVKVEEPIGTNIITVNRSNGTVLQIELEEYLVGVVAAEMPASFNIEALKAQAIVARTYTLKRISSGLSLTDTVATQEYKDVGQMRTMWQGEFDKYYNKIKLAVDTTKGIYITYNGNYIDAVYHSTSNGYTEDPIYVWGNDIPYLKSVESSFDKTASSYLRTETKDNNTILNILGILIDSSTPVEIISRNSSGRVTSVKIGENIYTGVNLRNILGLRSADFDIQVQDGNLIFTTRGYGHGVGMSQYGANGMANAGYIYNQILTHYYQGVQIES